nr:hypothetical protein HK105_006518 [Polyrhizophydium stewartii]
MAAASRFAGCADVADMLERLPFELGEAVFEHAGLATKLLHGRLLLPLDDRTSALVWIECMANDLVSCVPMLPQRRLTFEPYVAPPSDAMVAAIRARPDMALTDFGKLDQHTFAAKAATFSLDVCKEMLDLELRRRLGNTKLLQLVLDTQLFQMTMSLAGAFEAALHYDRVESVELLAQHTGFVGRKIIQTAVMSNAVKCFGVIESRFSLSSITLRSIYQAAKNSNGVILGCVARQYGSLSASQLDWLVKASVKYRRLDALRAMSNGGFRFILFSDIAAKAAARGDMELFAFFRPYFNNDYWFKDAMRIAAGKGDLDAVRLLHSDFDLACDHGAMDAAAAGGHMDVIEFLRAHRTEGFTGAAMIGAAQAGHLGVVRFLHEQRIECDDTKAMVCAAHNGHVGVLEFFRTKRGARCSAQVIKVAMLYNHDRVIQWLLEHFPDESKQEMTLCIMELIELKHFYLVSKLFRSKAKFAHEQILPKLLQHKCYDLVKVLLKSSHFSLPSKNLLLADCSRDFEAFRLLIEYGAAPSDDVLRLVGQAPFTPDAMAIADFLFERFPDLDWDTVAATLDVYSEEFKEHVMKLRGTSTSADQARNERLQPE